MKTFVELETFRLDGKLVITRVPANNIDEARNFRRCYWDLYNAAHTELFQNDFGETVLISIKQYGDKAQVQAGTYVL